jgi:hypothetical protein
MACVRAARCTLAWRTAVCLQRTIRKHGLPGEKALDCSEAAGYAVLLQYRKSKCLCAETKHLLYFFAGATKAMCLAEDHRKALSWEC